jgi:hypothetical protein
MTNGTAANLPRHRSLPGPALRQAFPSPSRSLSVDKNLLNPEALTVESFEVEGDSISVYMGNQMNCTGCDSGCGIFPNDP